METAAPDTRTALLLSALECFSEHGFDGTSTRMIADRAKRPLSLLAHYFKNKEGLYLEVFRLLFETTQKKRREPMPQDGYSPRDAKEAIRILREQVHFMYWDMVLDGQGLDPIHELGSRLWVQEIRSPRPSLQPLLLQHLMPITNTIKHCVQRLRPDLTEPEVIFYGCSIVGLVGGHGLMLGVNQLIWGKVDSPASPFQACEAIMELILTGLLGGQKPS